MRYNGYVYGVVWRFEARTWQTATKFIRSNALEISTIRQMHYTRCYRLVFNCLCYFFNQFATVFLSAVRWGRQALWLVLVVRLDFLSDQPMCLTTKGWI